jgi:hypothetical protein
VVELSVEWCGAGDERFCSFQRRTGDYRVGEIGRVCYAGMHVPKAYGLFPPLAPKLAILFIKCYMI